MIRYKKKTIELTEDGPYRPDRIIVDGVEFSMSRHAAAKKYNWQSTASGNILFYMSEDGTIFTVPQKILQNTFASEVYSLYKKSGLSQRKFAEKMGVPHRTLQDWLLMNREPAAYAQEPLLKKAAEIADQINHEHFDA